MVLALLLLACLLKLKCLLLELVVVPLPVVFTGVRGVAVERIGEWRGLLPVDGVDVMNIVKVRHSGNIVMSYSSLIASKNQYQIYFLPQNDNKYTQFVPDRSSPSSVTSGRVIL